MLLYLWSKLLKKLPGATIRNSHFEKPCKVEARTSFVNSSMGRYSYCGYGCEINNCEIGKFCSIGNNVSIGLSNHPLTWVSSSSAFFFGSDSIPKNIASLNYDFESKRVIIKNDVWVGKNVTILGGVTIGNGAVIGSGAIVTKDVAPYTIVAGNPAKIIRARFSNDLIDRLEKSEWWDFDTKKLKELSIYFDNPEKFLEVIEK